MNNYEPDWIELNDWILMKFPIIYDATKYLSNMSAQRNLWLKIWLENNSPVIW
jgi:hypothetical protein